jgi:hypothetical protein
MTRKEQALKLSSFVSAFDETVQDSLVGRRLHLNGRALAGRGLFEDEVDELLGFSDR